MQQCLTDFHPAIAAFLHKLLGSSLKLKSQWEASHCEKKNIKNRAKKKKSQIQGGWLALGKECTLVSAQLVLFYIDILPRGPALLRHIQFKFSENTGGGNRINSDGGAGNISDLENLHCWEQESVLWSSFFF